MSGRIGKMYSYLATFLLTSIVMVISGHYLLEVREYLYSSDKIDPRFLVIDPRGFAAKYANNPEREAIFEYARYDRTHFEPYIHFRRYPIETKYVNVDQDGMRRTIKNPRTQAKKVFMMGGSTIWGTGASDETTIPSLFQALLGSDYDVYNFGETGYVSTQELNQLLKALAEGDVPDYVIFYDGNNDGYTGGYSPAIPRDPHNVRKGAEAQKKAEEEVGYRLMRDWFEPSNYSKLFWRLKEKRIKQWDERIAGGEAVRAKKIVGYYDAHIRQVRALAKEYGFKVYFFWQANMLNPNRKPVSFEKEIFESSSPVFIESQRQVYYEAKKMFANRESEGVFFIGDMFNSVSDPQFLDWSHTTMEGNRIVAEVMFECLKAELGSSSVQRKGPFQ